MSEKIQVLSNSRAMVSINVPHLNLRCQWPKKGSKVMIEKEALESAMYDAGVQYLFESGLLYIEDMAIKKDLGLEPPEAEKPENIIILTDADKDEYLSPKRQAWELKDILTKLSAEGKKDFCDYVVEHEFMDTKKSAILKEICGVDTIRAIQMKQLNEE